jgi:hypothetical protein
MFCAWTSSLRYLILRLERNWIYLWDGFARLRRWNFRPLAKPFVNWLEGNMLRSLFEGSNPNASAAKAGMIISTLRHG